MLESQPHPLTSLHLIYSCQLKCLGYTHLKSFFFFLTELVFSIVQILDITFLKNGNFTLPQVSIRLRRMGLPKVYYFWL